MFDVLKDIIRNIYMHIRDLFKERPFLYIQEKANACGNFGGISRGDVLRIMVA